MDGLTGALEPSALCSLYFIPASPRLAQPCPTSPHFAPPHPTSANLAPPRPTSPHLAPPHLAPPRPTKPLLAPRRPTSPHLAQPRSEELGLALLGSVGLGWARLCLAGLGCAWLGSAGWAWLNVAGFGWARHCWASSTTRKGRKSVPISPAMLLSRPVPGLSIPLPPFSSSLSFPSFRCPPSPASSSPFLQRLWFNVIAQAPGACARAETAPHRRP